MATNYPPKHIWFDFAGTLYRETPDFITAHKEYRYKTYASLTGRTDIEKAKNEYDGLYDKHGSNSAVFRFLGQPADYWQKAVDTFNRQQFLTPDNQVIATLNALHKKLPISIFTNFMESKIEEMLSYLEIPRDYFTFILGGDSVAERKPALDGFYLMVERSNVPAQGVMYVGDRVAVDIVPAKSIGMQTCLLYGESEAADYCFDSFDDLLKLVK